VGDALSWTGGTGMIDRLDERFAAATEEALLARSDRAVVEALHALDERGRRRVLRAPEVTRRLLFAASAPNDTASFVARAVAVEMTLARIGAPLPTASWSALGDALVEPNGTAARWPQLDGDDAVVLDFGSPWAERIDLSGRDEYTSAPRPRFTDEQVRSIHQRLLTATTRLAELSPTLSAFVAKATCVLVLQIDRDAPHHVASGTNGHYIGRSFVTNPQIPEATLECITEGVVHEAIHGLLFRDSLLQPWVDGDAAAEVPRVQSPWTGRALPVRSFLEAVYVWFGLVHLWALATRTAAFDPDVARDRLFRCVKGFGFGSLVDRVQPWLPEIRPDVIETIDGLQGRVIEALVGTP
jgi:hypothetical protein